MKLHNSWKFLNTPKTAILSDPNQYNTMIADNSIALADSFVNENTAIIIELEYVVDVNGVTSPLICAKYEYVPTINSIMKMEDEDLDVKMTKGPDISLGDQLMLSDQAGDGEEQQAYEVAFRAYISSNKAQPDAQSLKRTNLSVPTDQSYAKQ